MKFIQFIFISFLVLFISGCGQEFIYKEYKNIDASGWKYEAPLEFAFEIKDTSSVYNLFLEVNHVDTFPSENAYVKVYTTFPDKHTTEQQLSLELAAKNGVWNGKCASGECTIIIGLQQNVVFAQAGLYKVRFEQFGRTSPLIGLSKIGFLVENTGKAKTQKKENKSKKQSK
ncbi:MAG: gliding motility lipoprotein GldH [Saprospiraceae bacterium]|nr:gliding motility lipoprotein GldH [Saprospiraceae bacterium]